MELFLCIKSSKGTDPVSVSMVTCMKYSGWLKVQKRLSLVSPVSHVSAAHLYIGSRKLPSFCIGHDRSRQTGLTGVYKFHTHTHTHIHTHSHTHTHTHTHRDLTVPQAFSMLPWLSLEHSGMADMMLPSLP